MILKQVTSSHRAKDRLSVKPSLTVWVCLLVLYADCLSGALRYGFSLIGVPVLNYVPFLLTFVLIGFRLFQMKDNRKSLRRIFLIVLFFLFSSVVGLFNALSSLQIVFAFYTWAPFFLGLIVVAEHQEEKILRHAQWLWLIAVTGVFLNYFVSFPWMGTSFEVMGIQVDAAREWYSGGVERLPGFSRASYTAAAQICLFGLLLISRYKSLILKLLVIILSAVAVAATTSKTPLAALFLSCLFLLSCHMLPKAKRSDRGLARYILFISLALLAIILGTPLYYLGTQGLNLAIVTDPTSPLMRLDSFEARITQMWPDAFRLLENDGSAGVWVLGRGLGGIGAGQTLGEASQINSADNMFVFLYVTFGCLSFMFAVWLLQGVTSLKNLSRDRQLLFAGPLVCMLILGITSNVIESVYPLFFLGLLSGRFGKNNTPT